VTDAKGSISIDYNFPSGTQGPEHVHPGMSYEVGMREGKEREREKEKERERRREKEGERRREQERDRRRGRRRCSRGGEHVESLGNSKNLLFARQ
jgi:hypothetical protein